MMRKILCALALAVLAGPAFADPISPAGCPSCIQNTAAAQNAQANVGTWTVRGTLSASTVTAQHLSITSMTAAQFAGGGAGLTNLNAGNVTSGVLSTSAVVGQYFGLTGAGVLSTGTWQASKISPQYGGTGQNWSAVSQGQLPFFTGTGTMGTLAAGAAGAVLQTQGAGMNPAWTLSPSVLGTNVTAIPLANLQAGELPSSITINDASISTLSAVKVVGDITGSASGLTAPLPVSGLQGGQQLPTSIPASSITITGVVPGVVGGPYYIPQINVHDDGRIYTSTQMLAALQPSQISAGALPGNVTVDPRQLSTGTFPTTAVASSITASGVAPGVYGGATAIPQVTIGSDGRVTFAQNVAIATGAVQSNVDNNWSHAQTSQSSWTFLSSVTAQNFLGNGAGLTHLTAANVDPGTFGAGVLLNAGSLVNGPVAASLLPSTVAYTSSSNTFTQAQAIAGFGLTAASATLTQTGASSFSLATSSGISMATGRLLVGAGGYVEWADGSRSTTAASGSSGGGGGPPSGPASNDLSGSYPGPNVSSATTGAGLFVKYGVRAGSAAFTAGLTASSGTFTQTADYSVVTSSGLSVPGTAGVYAGFFVGSGVGLTGITGATDNTKVLKTGDTMTGGLTMAASSITLTGANGYVASASSVNASGLFANGVNVNGNQGSTLSCSPSQTVVNTVVSGGVITGGICGSTGGGAAAIGWNADDFTASANGVTQDFTLSATVANSSGVFIVRDGLTLRPNADYVFTPPTSLHMNTAPSGATTSFFATYTVNLASGALAAVLNSTQTFSGTVTFANAVVFSSAVTFSQGQPAYLASTQTFSALTTFTQLVKITSGAAAGLVLTSDAAGNASWQPAAAVADAAVLTATQTFSGRDTFTNNVAFSSSTNVVGLASFASAPVFSSGAVGNYFAMSDNIGTLNWVPGSTVRAQIAADPILFGISVMSNNATCTTADTSCFIPNGASATMYYKIAPYVLHIATQGINAAVTTETDAQTGVFTTATLRNLVCNVGSGSGSGDTAVFTVKKNGSNTTMTCSLGITTAGGVACSDTTHTVSAVAGDLVAITITRTGGNGRMVANGACYFQMAF